MDLIWMRESHMVTCPSCGGSWDEWDTGIGLKEAIARMQRDTAALADLQVRSCPRCGHRIEWDVAIVPGERGTLPPYRQRRLAATLRRLLREDASREQIVETVQEKYGVVAFYVRQKPTPADELA